jgi:hypothetical protein
MRQQQDNIFSELFQDDEIKVPKIVQEYRDTYNKIGALLHGWTEILGQKMVMNKVNFIYIFRSIDHSKSI